MTLSASARTIQFYSFFRRQTVIRKFWRAQYARQRCSRPLVHTQERHAESEVIVLVRSTVIFQMRRRKAKTDDQEIDETVDAVIGEVDGCVSMETFADQGGHLSNWQPAVESGQPVQISIIIGVMYSSVCIGARCSRSRSMSAHAAAGPSTFSLTPCNNKVRLVRGIVLNHGLKTCNDVGTTNLMDNKVNQI